MWAMKLVLLVIGSARGLVRLDPLVDAPAGLIRGLRADDGEYSMFLGIPYAQVEDDNPFGASIPQPKFDSIFDAFDDSVLCPQVEDIGKTIVGTVDCLHLNLYVPNKASASNRLPVLVSIHGGAFSIGSASSFIYGPKYLVRHDVILVTFNYRVGPYGFFCLDTPEVPGNQGLKDQVLALRWVKENVASFGGDVNKVTVMGAAAGGVSVDLHFASPQETLFDQAIIQSGSMLIPGLLEESGRSKALSIAQKLGIETEDIAEAVAFLTKADVEQVIAATDELGLTSRPCVEKVFENVDSILTEHPINIDRPKVRNMPVLVGFNNKERLVKYATMSDAQFKNRNFFEESLQKIFVYDEDFKAMEDIVRRFYIGDEEMSEALRANLTDFDSDYDFAFSIQTSLKKYLESGAKDVYYYMFSYSGDRNYAKQRLNITEPGAAHSDEISYLFDLSYEKEPSAADQLVIDQMTTLWTNFAKFGDPTPQTSELLPVKWLPISEHTFTYLNIDEELSLGARPYHERMAFWELFFEVNQHKLKGYRGN